MADSNCLTRNRKGNLVSQGAGGRERVIQLRGRRPSGLFTARTLEVKWQLGDTQHNSSGFSVASETLLSRRRRSLLIENDIVFWEEINVAGGQSALVVIANMLQIGTSEITNNLSVPTVISGMALNVHYEESRM